MSHDTSYLIYVSTATITRYSAEHANILRAARARNAGLGLTGFLHREEEAFVQYIEGSVHGLRQVMTLIHADPRHDSVTILCEGTTKGRRFCDWTMGYCESVTLPIHSALGEPRNTPLRSCQPAKLIGYLANLSETAKDLMRMGY